MANDRMWDGKAVYARGDSKTPRRPIAVALTEQGARTVALALARLKQTTLTLPGDAQELLMALDYVMVADPASVRAHREMEAGKGMTPDGGFKEPENLSRLDREAREGAELNPDRRTDGQRTFNEQMGWMQ